MKNYLVAALKLYIFACLSDILSSFGGAERKCSVMKSAGESPATKVFTVPVAQRALWPCAGAWWVQHDAWVQSETGKQTVRLGATTGQAEGARIFHLSPGALGGTGGAVQAALWQRPAEICRTFFPCKTVTRVGSRTWLVWPKPSWE